MIYCSSIVDSSQSLGLKMLDGERGGVGVGVVVDTSKVVDAFYDGRVMARTGKQVLDSTLSCQRRKCKEQATTLAKTCRERTSPS